MIDTVTTTITSSHGTITIISSLLSPIEWVSLYFGLIMYWLKKLDEVRIENHEKPIKEYLAIFFRDNWIEIPTSGLSCLCMALFSSEIPASLLVMKGIVALFCIGYANSSILNRVITRVKPQVQVIKNRKRRNPGEEDDDRPVE